MRPIYETEESRRIERAIADKVAWTYGFSMVKTEGDFPRLDFSVERKGCRVAHAEIKRRYFRFNNSYADVILSLSKVGAAREVNRMDGLPCWFIVEFDDDYIACADMLPERPVTWGGRRDRGDPYDIEWLVRIPKADFGRLVISYVWTQAELEF